MMYVIYNLDNGKYAKRFGHEASYTDKLQHAQTFNTLEEAQRHCCGNELVISLEEAMRGYG
jgi:hypothetical protein